VTTYPCRHGISRDKGNRRAKKKKQNLKKMPSLGIEPRSLKFAIPNLCPAIGWEFAQEYPSRVLFQELGFECAYHYTNRALIVGNYLLLCQYISSSRLCGLPTYRAWPHFVLGDEVGWGVLGWIRRYLLNRGATGQAFCFDLAATKERPIN